MSRLRLVWCAGLSIAALGLAPLAARSPILLWNASASAPIGLYRLEGTVPVGLGDQTAWRPPVPWAGWFAARGYVPVGVPLIKTVAAVTPSVVCRDGDRLFIDGRPAAQARRRDTAGRPLPRWQGCVRLGPDDVLILSPGVPDALDGRYFGPVSRGDLMGRVTPIGVWDRGE